MQQYQTFIFDAYSFNPEEGIIELHYSLDGDLHFTETLILPQGYKQQALSTELDSAFRALHLIAGISYYKTCCPKQIAVKTGTLTQEQSAFWDTVYEKGLGEFFYKNRIDFRGLINFPGVEQTANSKQQTGPASQSPISNPSPSRSGGTSPRSYDQQTLSLNILNATAKPGNPQPRILVPIGGGKDSTVTIELLKKAGYDVTLFRIGHHPLIEQTAAVAGRPLLTVERRLDPLLFRLNANGALNGHVPITAYLSLLSVVIAKLYGFSAVVMSNERSANEGNVSYLGEKINHQWSKSLESERLIQTYLKKIGISVQYFSLLRPFSELAIAKMFSGFPQYFPCTTSCNTNWKIANRQSPISSRWCGGCPKCAFVFVMFAAFLPLKTLQEIFGQNLFDTEALQPLYRQLLGLEGFKPFECVGTPEETKAAFLLAHERGELDQTKAMQLFLLEVLPTMKDSKKLIEDALTPSPDHSIPNHFLPCVSSAESHPRRGAALP